MHLDVQDLKNFYYRSALGRTAQRAVRDQIVEFWPEAKGQTVAGFGFAVPLMRPYLAEARRCIGLMPAQQGVMPWPAGMHNVSVLCDETHLPLDTGVVDRLVVMHGIETSDDQAALLAEIWRVLGPGGRAIFVVPNRAGLWARSDLTPFGYGRPYSLLQLETQLKRNGFTPERHAAALYAPPSHKRVWRKFSPICERVGRRMSPYMVGGVFIVEVTKQVHAPTRPGLPDMVRRPLKLLEGLAKPEATPV